MKDLLLGNHKYWKTSSSNLEIFIGQITYLHLTYFFLKGFTLCLCLEHTVYCLILPNSCLFVNILQVRYLKKNKHFLILDKQTYFGDVLWGPAAQSPLVNRARDLGMSLRGQYGLFCFGADYHRCTFPASVVARPYHWWVNWVPEQLIMGPGLLGLVLACWLDHKYLLTIFSFQP